MNLNSFIHDPGFLSSLTEYNINRKINKIYLDPRRNQGSIFGCLNSFLNKIMVMCFKIFFRKRTANCKHLGHLSYQKF